MPYPCVSMFWISVGSPLAASSARCDVQMAPQCVWPDVLNHLRELDRRSPRERCRFDIDRIRREHGSYARVEGESRARAVCHLSPECSFSDESMLHPKRYRNLFTMRR